MLISPRFAYEFNAYGDYAFTRFFHRHIGEYCYEFHHFRNPSGYGGIDVYRQPGGMVHCFRWWVDRDASVDDEEDGAAGGTPDVQDPEVEVSVKG